MRLLITLILLIMPWMVRADSQKISTQQALALGVVQGLTEFLPVSSTGHMILVNEFLKLKVTPEFMEMFLVVIQLGAILAVIFMFFKKLNPIKKDKQERKSTINLWIRVIIGCIPAGIIGILFDDAL